MLIRVDEFPRCDTFGRRMFDAWAVLDEFMGILRAPFCLAVIVGNGTNEWATMHDLERLRKLDGVTLAAHGLGHVSLGGHTDAGLATLAKMFPSKIAVPPFNKLNQAAVDMIAKAGFTALCTGPETRRECPSIRFDRIREVPSIFYGHLSDSGCILDVARPRPFGVFDCVTLHMCWESWTAPRFEYLRRFVDIYREQIVGWDRLIGAAK